MAVGGRLDPLCVHIHTVANDKFGGHDHQSLIDHHSFMQISHTPETRDGDLDRAVAEAVSCLAI